MDVMHAENTSRNTQAISAGVLLILSHLAVFLPALILCGLLLGRYVGSEYGRHELQAHSRADQVATLIDKRIATVTAVAEALAASTATVDGNLDAFTLDARNILHRYGEQVDLTDAGGRALVSVRIDGIRPSAPAPPEVNDLAAKESRAVVSDLVLGAGAAPPSARVVVPVLAGPYSGERFVEIAFELDRLYAVLKEANLPDGWFAGLVDGNYRFIARSRLNAETIGQLAPEEFRGQVGPDARGLIRLVNPEGVEVLNAYRRLNNANWIASVGVSTKLLSVPLRRSLLEFAAIGALLMLLMLVTASYLSRRLRNAGQRLLDLTVQVGQNRIVEPVATRVQEVDEVGHALARLSRDLLTRSAERDASEARYRQAVEVGRLGSWETDFAAGKRHWSPEAMTIFGLNLQGGIGEVDGPDDDWRNAFLPEDRKVADDIRERLKTEDELDVEYRIRRPDGQIVYLHGHARVLARDRDGRVLKLINVVADVTSRRAAEKALGQTEARYRLLFENIDAGFCIVEVIQAGPEGRIDYRVVEANPAFFRQTGFPADIVGRWLREAAPELEEHWFQTYGRVARTGVPERFEEHAQGLGRWFDVFAFRIDDGDPNRVAILFTDITQRRTAEEELRLLNLQLEERVDSALAERRLLADVLENTAIFIQVVGRDWCWLAINRAAAEEFERIFGVRPEVGEDMRQLLASKPEHKVAVEAIWARALAGETFSETAEFGDPGLKRRAYEMRFYPLRDASGTLIGAYQFVADVTERIAAERKLNEMQKMETIGHLTGGVAHDFNNLLSAILSNLHLLRKNTNDVRSARLLDGAIRGAERGASLTRRLLAFARRQELKSEAVNLNALVEDMRDLIDRSRGDAVEVNVAIPENLPAVNADSHQLELAILNLVINARDAMPGGGRIAIAAEVENAIGAAPVDLLPGGYVRLRVTDTGQGMDAETLQRATEPFFTTKGIGKGTGLGLSMVQGLAAQSGGAMHIDSTVGEGTTITLWLPLATEPALLQVEKAEPPVADVRDPARFTVLVVDDDFLVSMGTAAMLEDLGHTPIEASGGRQALELLGSNGEIDVVITDQSMPGMTGVELCGYIAKDYPDLPIILASGYADFPAELDPAIPRLSKPFSQGDLAATLARVLTRDRQSARTAAK